MRGRTQGWTRTIQQTLLGFLPQPYRRLRARRAAALTAHLLALRAALLSVLCWTAQDGQDFRTGTSTGRRRFTHTLRASAARALTLRFTTGLGGGWGMPAHLPCPAGQASSHPLGLPPPPWGYMPPLYLALPPTCHPTRHSLPSCEQFRSVQKGPHTKQGWSGRRELLHLPKRARRRGAGEHAPGTTAPPLPSPTQRTSTALGPSLPTLALHKHARPRALPRDGLLHPTCMVSPWDRTMLCSFFGQTGGHYLLLPHHYPPGLVCLRACFLPSWEGGIYTSIHYPALPVPARASTFRLHYYALPSLT